MYIERIDDFLNKAENADIVQRHFKLWLHSTNLLTNMMEKNISIDTQVFLANIKKHKQMYVETEAYRQAKEILLQHRVLLIIGAPGVGKTITSEMLTAYFAAQGYRIRYTTNSENLDSLKRSLSDDGEQKEFILLDDCFGQCYFKMKGNQDGGILSLINYVAMSPGKVLLLNSRVTIYREARTLNPFLDADIERGLFRVRVLDMTNISALEKGQILYNHLYFSGLPRSYFTSIRSDQNYLKIIHHKNYTPRIIEFATLPNVKTRVQPEYYFNYIMGLLNNPREIWQDEYLRRLQPADRVLVTTLYSLTETTVDTVMLRKCYNHRLMHTPGIDHTADNWSMSLQRLNESFVQVVDMDGREMIRVVNPSVNDFLNAYLTEDCPERQSMERSILTIRQAYRLLKDPELFLMKKFQDGTIMNFAFEDVRRRDEWILYGVCEFGVCRSDYAPFVKAFLKRPRGILATDNGQPWKTAAQTIVSLFAPEVCQFYQTYAVILNRDTMEGFVDSATPEDLVELLLAVEEIYPLLELPREEYLELIRGYMFQVFSRYAGSLSADQLGAYDYIDVTAMIEDDYTPGEVDDEVFDEIISLGRAYLENVLERLPYEMQYLVNLDKDIVYWTDDAYGWYNSYMLAITPPDMDDYLDKYYSREFRDETYRKTGNADIDDLFDREYGG